MMNNVADTYHRTYSFVWKQMQYIYPGYLTNNRITGLCEWKLKQIESEHIQVWTFRMKDLQFDWNPNSVAEMYFLFAFPACMDIKIDQEGSITGVNTDFDLCSVWNKTYKNELYERIAEKEQADALWEAINGENRMQLALGLLKVNPIVSALCNMIKLNHKLKYNHEPVGEFGERFTGEIEKPDYFAEGIALPLKTTWLKRELENEKEEEWTHLGGLVSDRYREDEVRKMLRLITGEQNPAVDVEVSFTEVYRMDQREDDYRLISYGLFQTSTRIQSLWEKAEELELTIEKSEGGD